MFLKKENLDSEKCVCYFVGKCEWIALFERMNATVWQHPPALAWDQDRDVIWRGGKHKVCYWHSSRVLPGGMWGSAVTLEKAPDKSCPLSPNPWGRRPYKVFWDAFQALLYNHRWHRPYIWEMCGHPWASCPAQERKSSQHNANIITLVL